MGQARVKLKEEYFRCEHVMRTGRSSVVSLGTPGVQRLLVASNVFSFSLLHDRALDF